MSRSLSRRSMMKSTVAAAAGAAVLNAHSASADEPDAAWKIEKGRIRQSVVPWCFNNVSIGNEKFTVKEEELAAAAEKLGLKSVELGDRKLWPMLKKLGLTCAITGSHGFVSGFNHVENHDMCVEKVTQSVEAAADFGCPSVICFSGMKKLKPNDPKCPEISDEEVTEEHRRRHQESRWARREKESHALHRSPEFARGHHDERPSRLPG